MRETNITPKEPWFDSRVFQDAIDAFWTLIEDMYEEDWRLEANGDMTLEVDDAMLERVLNDNIATAWYVFGAFKGGEKDGKRFFLDRPEYLKGTYTIKGVYHYSEFVNWARTYYFTKEGN